MRRNASDQPAARSVRFRADHSASDTDNEAPRKTPIALAEAHIAGHVATLQPQLASILKRLGIQHVRLLIKAHHKNRQITKMNDPEYVPRSAEINFNLNVARSVEQAEGFQAIKEDCTRLVADFRQSLKAKLRAVLQLEISCLQTQAVEDLAKAIRLTCQAFKTVDRSTTATADQLASALVSQHHAVLFKHVQCNVVDFGHRYCAAHNIDSFPVGAPAAAAPAAAAAAAAPAAAAGATASRHFGGQAAAAAAAPAAMVVEQPAAAAAPTPDVAAIKIAVEAVFVTAFNKYVEQMEKDELGLSLTKLEQEFFGETKTSAADSLLDQELPKTPEELQDLVRKEVASALRQSKNSERGRGGASKKEKNRSTPNNRRPRRQGRAGDTSRSPSRRSQSPSRRRGRAAAASGNGTPSANAVESNKSGNRNRRRRNAGTDTRRSKSQPRSGGRS
mmetsp:Transcript_4370/g.9501  ORF Transcript_4370/g.9501 Transcript_4370/m.9501 type:complete len:447 (+) Transcript_4370:128-1468(+)